MAEAQKRSGMASGKWPSTNIPRQQLMRDIVVDFSRNTALDANGELQGELAEAERLQQQALQESEKDLGAEHKSTLDTARSLGLFYANYGMLAKAEKMYQRALQGYEKTQGADHISTLNTVYNLGLLAMNQGKLGEARQMFRRALQGYEKVLGKHHTSTLDTVYNLGLLHLKERSLFQASEMYNRALQGYEKTLGPDDEQCRRVPEVIKNIRCKICLLPW